MKRQSIIMLFIVLLLTLNIFKLNFNVSVANPGVIKVPLNYPTIQGAINHATPGDTIEVAAGIYYERIVVNKTVTLKGESAATTIIDGNKGGIIVSVTLSSVEIFNFTIRNGGYYAAIWVEDPLGKNTGGIRIKDNILSSCYLGVLFSRVIYSEITNNKILNNQVGIRTTFSSFNTIQNNFINSSFYHGIHLHSYSENNTIKLNTIEYNRYGILDEQSDNNYLFGNMICSLTSKSGYGIRLTTTKNTRIEANTMQTNYYGIVLWESSINNRIYHNNFIDNSIQQYHYNTLLTGNIWDTDVCPGAQGNYWSDYTGVDDGSGEGRWHEPRVAGDGIGDTLIPHQSVDHYPLMHPYSLYPIARFTYYPDPPYTDETVTFDASASSGDIVSYRWNFGDSPTNYTEADPIITHIYASTGNYTVTLTVTDRNGFWGSTSKLISVRPFRLVIDVYTQKEPYSGKGPNMPSDAFAPQEEVILYAIVTYNDNPVPDKIVGFYVYKPNATDPFLYRTNVTDINGIAWTSFRLNSTSPFGIYHAVANVEVGDTTAEDTLPFRVGWIIEILAIEARDKDGNLRTVFWKEETVYFNIIVENIAFLSKNATLTIDIYDETKTPIGTAYAQLNIGPGWSELPMVANIMVPKWSIVGPAQAHSDAYTKWLWDDGVPYCPEKSATIVIYP